MTANHIQTVFGYQTNDGQKFHDLGEAQKHTRRSLYGIIFDRAVAADLKFARLDKDLLMDFLMTGGTALAKIATDPLAATAPVYANGSKIMPGAATTVPFRPRTLDPAATVAGGIDPATGQPIDALKTAMENVTEAERAEAARTKFGAHPLDTQLDEVELESELGRVMAEARKNSGA